MPRKIEKQDALDRALTLFWDNGYRGTSMDMLTTSLGVEKPSVYATFGSKQGLYLAALQQYRQWVVETMTGLLDGAPDVRTGIDRTVRTMMARSTRGHRKGCFATNSALELSDHDDEARDLVRDTFADMAALLRKAIQRAQAEGSVRSDSTAEVLAQYLLNGIEGAKILERTKASARSMDEVAALTLRVLDPPA